ncbi:MAG TPA: YkgJ family cysteine cluster protein [bacterium]|nr:YkgJ family cysteine cluster protein [bacterium]
MDGATGFLAPDSSVAFECECCGVCCASGLEIFLNTVDIFKLRAYFKRPTRELIEEYLILEQRAEYGAYPLCLIRMGEGGCPFLDGRLCSVHPARPAGCRLFPVIHYHDASRGEVFAFAEDMNFCPGRRRAEERPLTDWLEENVFRDYEKASQFQKMLAPLSRCRVPENVSETLFGTLFDFDSAEGFPFVGAYDAGADAMAEALEWTERRLIEILRRL